MKRLNTEIVEVELDNEIIEALEQIAIDEEKSVDKIISNLVYDYVVDDCY